MFFCIQSVSTGLVLDVTTDGPIITYEYHGGPNQLFRYDQETEMLHSALNGQVLDATEDSQVILYEAHGGLNQRWTFENDLTIMNRGGMVLDVENGDKSGNIIVFPKHGGSNQLFRRVYV